MRHGSLLILVTLTTINSGDIHPLQEFLIKHLIGGRHVMMSVFTLRIILFDQEIVALRTINPIFVWLQTISLSYQGFGQIVFCQWHRLMLFTAANRAVPAIIARRGAG